MSEIDRFRLVILGGAGVGKSCLIKRFLLKTYTDKYRATIEDLYNREYDLGHMTLKVYQYFARIDVYKTHRNIRRLCYAFRIYVLPSSMYTLG